MLLRRKISNTALEATDLVQAGMPTDQDLRLFLSLLRENSHTWVL
jgi:hypothetical protein